MGHVRVTVKIGHPARRDEAVEVENVLVDTGATWTVIPRSLADHLGLEVLGRKRVQTANGEITVDHSYAYVELEGHETVSDIMITDTFPDVLIGVFTLEGMALAVDPKNGRLVDTQLLLL
jgi:aspartyl protease family protein